MTTPSSIRAAILDLDGTLYAGTQEIPGAFAFIQFLKRLGWLILYVTNRANRLPGEISEHLRQYGIACNENDVLTSSLASGPTCPQVSGEIRQASVFVRARREGGSERTRGKVLEGWPQ